MKTFLKISEIVWYIFITALVLFLMWLAFYPLLTYGFHGVNLDEWKIIFAYIAIAVFYSLHVALHFWRKQFEEFILKIRGFFKLIDNPLMFLFGDLGLLYFLAMLVLTICGKAKNPDMNWFISITLVAMIIVCAVMIRQSISPDIRLIQDNNPEELEKTK